MTQTQSAEELRAAAMALMAQAEAVEQAPEAPGGPDDYFAWALDHVNDIDQVDMAWHHIVDTWDELDGDETLQLLAALIARIGDPTAPPEVPEVPEVPEIDWQDPTVLRSLLGLMGSDPAKVPADDELRALAPGILLAWDGFRGGSERAELTVPANPWPVGTAAHERFGARLQPRVNGERPQPVLAAPAPPADLPAPPRGMKRRTSTAEFNPEAPFDHLGQAAVPMNGPLKTAAPRKPSKHEIPDHLQQWKRDGAGRRVPIDTPEA